MSLLPTPSAYVSATSTPLDIAPAQQKSDCHLSRICAVNQHPNPFANALSVPLPLRDQVNPTQPNPTQHRQNKTEWTQSPLADLQANKAISWLLSKTGQIVTESVQSVLIAILAVSLLVKCIRGRGR